MEARERVLKALEDVQDCDDEGGAASQGKDLAYYRHDRLFRQAVERNLEIIGEAIGRISRYDAETAARVSEHRRIIGFRNRLIHGYDVLDDSLVWETVKTDVPMLLSEVEGLLKELEEPDSEEESSR